VKISDILQEGLIMMPEKSFMESILIGNTPGVEIIDCHGHMGTYGKQYIPYKGDPTSMISMMDMAGIGKTCISHLLVLTGDIREGNRLSCDAASRHSGRFLVYLGYNPNYPAEYNMQDIQKHIDRSEVIGLKFHTTLHQSTPDDPRYNAAYELAEERKLVILCHTWGIRDIKGIENTARNFPGVVIIIGHSGGAEFSAVYEAVRVAGKYENVYLDLCISAHYEGLVELFVNEVSAGKVLFGSDIPFIDPRAGLGRVIFSRISDMDKEKILGGNMKAILNLQKIRRNL